MKQKSQKKFISKDDPLGSYTGNSTIVDDDPVQDADDL